MPRLVIWLGVFAAALTLLPRAVTHRTRPPLVTRRSSTRRVPA